MSAEVYNWSSWLAQLPLPHLTTESMQMYEQVWFWSLGRWVAEDD